MSPEVYVGAVGAVIAVVAAVIGFLQLRRTPKSGIAGLEKPALQTVTAVRAPAHNLPAREQFIGRSAEKARLLEGLESSYPVVAVEGLGGMGKTALVREVAWSYAETQEKFPAIVWTEDRGGSLRLNDVLDAIADVLGFTYLHSMPLPEKENEVRKLLRTHGCLLVVDNLDTVADEQVLNFVTGIPEPPSKAVVTSREQRLRAAWAVPLGKLDEADGLELIRSEAMRLALPPLRDAAAADLRTLYDATGGNPLAIRLGVGQMKAGGASLAEIIEDLATAADEDLFKVLFERSWSKTLAGDEYAKRVLATLALCPGSAARATVEAGSDVHHAYLSSALSRLIAVSLVDPVDLTPVDGSRYQLHTLTRAFVRKQIEATPPTTSELRDRLDRHFLEFAQRHANTDADLENVRRIGAELPNIMAFADAADQEAARTDDPTARRKVIDYADALASYLWGRGFWADRIRLSERAMAAAIALEDTAALARHAILIGRVHLWRNDPETARKFLAQAREALGEETPSVKRFRAQIATEEGDYELAQSLLEAVLEAAPNTSDDEGRAATHLELGRIAERREDLETAKVSYEEALRLDDELGSVEGRAVSLSHLGRVLLAMKDHAVAETVLRAGLAVSTGANRLSARARCELGLANLCASRGLREEARAHAGSAELLYARLGQPELAAEAREVLVRSTPAGEPS